VVLHNNSKGRYCLEMIIVLYHAHSPSHGMKPVRLELLLMIASLIELYSGLFSSHASGSEVIY